MYDKNIHYKNLFKILILPFSLVVLRFLFLTIPLPYFISLPRVAIDGTWAESFLNSQHTRNFNNFQELKDNSVLVLQGIVYNRDIEVFSGGRYNDAWGATAWQQFYVYSLEVTNVYANNLPYISEAPQTINIGDTIQFFQHRRLNRRGHTSFGLVSSLAEPRYDLIYSPINVGDKIVVFLTHNNTIRINLHDETLTLTWSLTQSVPNRSGRINRRNIRRIPRHNITQRVSGIPTPNSLFILINKVQAVYK